MSEETVKKGDKKKVKEDSVPPPKPKGKSKTPEQLWDLFTADKIIAPEFRSIFLDMMKTIKDDKYNWKADKKNTFNFAITGVHILVRFSQLLNELEKSSDLKVVYPSKGKLQKASAAIKKKVKNKTNIKHSELGSPENYSTFNGDIGAGEFGNRGQLHNLTISHPAQVELIKKFETRFISGAVGNKKPKNDTYGIYHGAPSKELYHIFTAHTGNWKKAKKSKGSFGSGQAGAFNEQVPGVFGICTMNAKFVFGNDTQDKDKKSVLKQLFDIDGLGNHLDDSTSDEIKERAAIISGFFKTNTFIDDLWRFCKSLKSSLDKKKKAVADNKKKAVADKKKKAVADKKKSNTSRKITIGEEEVVDLVKIDKGEIKTALSDLGISKTEIRKNVKKMNDIFLIPTFEIGPRTEELKNFIEENRQLLNSTNDLLKTYAVKIGGGKPESSGFSSESESSGSSSESESSESDGSSGSESDDSASSESDSSDSDIEDYKQVGGAGTDEESEEDEEGDEGEEDDKDGEYIDTDPIDDMIDQITMARNELTSLHFLKKYFASQGKIKTYVDNQGDSYKTCLLKANRYMNKFGYMINKNNIHIINFIWETSGKNDIKFYTLVSFMTLKNEKYKIFTFDYESDEVSPGICAPDRTMFFTLAILILCIKYPQESNDWPETTPPEVITTINGNIGMGDNISDYGFSYINKVFWHVSNHDDANKRNNFMKKYLKYGFSIIPMILTNIIKEKCIDGNMTFYDMYKNGVYDFCDGDFLENVNDIWCNEKIFGRLFFIYLCVDMEFTEKFRYSKSLTYFFMNHKQIANIKREQVVGKGKVKILEFFKKQKFNNKKRKILTGNIRKRKNIAFDYQVNEILMSIVLNDPNEVNGIFKGGGIAAANSKEMEDVDIRLKSITEKLDNEIKEAFKTRVSKMMKNKMSISGKVDILKDLNVKKNVVEFHKNTMISLYDVYNLNNIFITKFLLELLMNHKNTQLVFDTRAINVRENGFTEHKFDYKKEKSKYRDSMVTQNFSGKFTDVDGTIFLFFCCNKDDENQKHSGDLEKFIHLFRVGSQKQKVDEKRYFRAPNVHLHIKIVSTDPRNVESSMGQKINSFPLNQVKLRNSIIFDEGWWQNLKDNFIPKSRVTNNEKRAKKNIQKQNKKIKNLKYKQGVAERKIQKKIDKLKDKRSKLMAKRKVSNFSGKTSDWVKQTEKKDKINVEIKKLEKELRENRSSFNREIRVHTKQKLIEQKRLDTFDMNEAKEPSSSEEEEEFASDKRGDERIGDDRGAAGIRSRRKLKKARKSKGKKKSGVSEKDWLKLVKDFSKNPTTGFFNEGVTCWLASFLQVVFYLFEREIAEKGSLAIPRSYNEYENKKRDSKTDDGSTVYELKQRGTYDGNAYFFTVFGRFDVEDCNTVMNLLLKVFEEYKQLEDKIRNNEPGDFPRFLLAGISSKMYGDLDVVKPYISDNFKKLIEYFWNKFGRGQKDQSEALGEFAPCLVHYEPFQIGKQTTNLLYFDQREDSTIQIAIDIKYEVEQSILITDAIKLGSRDNVGNFLPKRNLVQDIESLLSWQILDETISIPEKVWITEDDSKKYYEWDINENKKRDKKFKKKKVEKQPWGNNAVDPQTIREKIKLVMDNSDKFTDAGIELPKWPYVTGKDYPDDDYKISKLEEMDQWKLILNKLHRGGKNKLIIFPETKYIGICYHRVGFGGKWYGEIEIPEDSFVAGNHRFKIVGITYHGGSESGGHYVAEKLSLDGNKKYYLNDKRTTTINDWVSLDNRARGRRKGRHKVLIMLEVIKPSAPAPAAALTPSTTGGTYRGIKKSNTRRRKNSKSNKKTRKRSKHKN